MNINDLNSAFGTPQPLQHSNPQIPSDTAPPNWEDNIVEGATRIEEYITNVEETDCEICVTWKVPGVGDGQGLGDLLSGWVDNDIADIVWGSISERFEDGQYTTCFRKKNCREEEIIPDPPNNPPYAQPAWNLHGGLSNLDQRLSCQGWIRFDISFSYFFHYKRISGYSGETLNETFIEPQPTTTISTLLLNPTRIVGFFEIDRIGNQWIVGERIYCYGQKDIDESNEQLFNGEYYVDAWARSGSYQWPIGRVTPVEWVVIGGALNPRISHNCESSPNYPRTGQPTNPRRNSMAECCEQLRAELAEIKRNQIEIMQWLGCKQPIEVPAYLHDKSPGSNWLSNAWDFLFVSDKKRIESFPQLVKWYIEKLQEQWGTWPPIYKDFKDNEVGLPNQAEAWKALFMKLTAMDRSISLLQQANAKLACELGITRQELILTKSAIDATNDFMEIPLEEKTLEIVHQFSIPEDRVVSDEEVDTDAEFDKFFEASKFQAKIVDFNPTKEINGKKPETFGTHTKRILKIMEILLAVHSVPIDKDDIEGSLRKFVRETLKFSKGKALDGRSVGSDDDNDLSQYLEKVETMFAAEENAPTDASVSPWGNSLDERPKIIIKGIPPTEGDDM